ncbi:MAG: DUF3108 domain-containing protein, partial [Terriglobia bacterium]
LFLRLAVPTWSAAAVQHPGLSASTVPFEVGERFTYNVSWKVFDAGIATMTLAEKTTFQNEEAYRINATVYSTGIVSALFKVVDVFESFFQARDLCSRRITKKIQEGRRHRETVVTFDAKARRAQMEDRDLNLPDLPPKRTESPVSSCVQDVLSALYVIRTKTLRVGELVQFPINDGGRTYDVTVEIQAQEEVRTPAGTFQAFRLEPKVFDGLFKSKGRLFVWVTADAARMPVQLKAKITIGTITASLTQADRIPLPEHQHPPSKL